ncbi:MAG TPA: phosphoadenylyl-sulfate reductase [Leptospiraceae bacterium]|nr:phosphoadenylyl-sulfate reductase [Spirochaetaceae bacterium]HBS06783.1 phosphoadenylyl-sulfate reductase [Leptospiraceae bacterium]|tara:strand:+ start:9756 stop:10505 length:750 start_codon:yes stop_codon:yes gene_type:complete
MALDMDWKEIADLNKDPGLNDAQAIMDWASRSGLKLGLASSFSAEDTSLIHLLHSAIEKNPEAAGRLHVFYLETGRLHEETLQTLEECRKRYPGVEFRGFFPDRERVEALIRNKGLFSFYDSIDNRKECCFVRKVEPLNRALNELDGWITGLRQSQSVTRANLPAFQLDTDHGGILKLNPLTSWEESDVYSFIEENDVPLNALHRQGFPSIGCAPCTRAIQEGEDIRAGRWWWENPEHKECGLHAGGAR